MFVYYFATIERMERDVRQSDEEEKMEKDPLHGGRTLLHALTETRALSPFHPSYCAGPAPALSGANTNGARDS
jgi:hypothetical protein